MTEWDVSRPFDVAMRGAFWQLSRLRAQSVTLIALILSILLGAGSLSWGYAGVGLPQLARWIGFFGALLAGGSVAALALVLLRRAGCVLLGRRSGPVVPELPSGLDVCRAPSSGLMAWDLTDFRYRQSFAASDAERRSVELRHLLRLSSIWRCWDLALASLAMIVKLQFSFEWMVFSGSRGRLGTLADHPLVSQPRRIVSAPCMIGRAL